MRILVVEDETRLAGLLQHSLKEEGHAVDVVLTGEGALAQQRLCNYDVVVLDRMLPDIDGLDICRTLRRWRVQTPILLLTARRRRGPGRGPRCGRRRLPDQALRLQRTGGAATGA